MSLEQQNQIQKHHEKEHRHAHSHESCHCEAEHAHSHESCHCEAEHAHSHESCHCEAEHAHHLSHSHTGKGKKKVFILENLGCANCAAKIEKKISTLPGVTSAVITFPTKKLQITAKESEQYLEKIQEICSAIESEVQVKEAAESYSRETAKAHAGNHKKEQRRDLAVILIGAGLFVAGEILGQIAGVPKPVSAGIFLAAYLILGGEILVTAIRNILKGQIFDENFLMSIATIGAVITGQFAEAVGVMLFYRIGEFFEHVAVERSRSQIMEAVDFRPEVVNLVAGEDVQVIPAKEARPGDVLLVRPGDRIPLDGFVVEGESRIDTSPITGEPVPVKADVGSAVISGCVNTLGLLKIRVEKPLSESMVTRILDSVENAAASKPKIDRFITRFARIYTPIVVLLALGTAIVPSLITGDWNHWVYTALTFLVISCPCALVLSVPLAFFSGIGAGSRKGILFKGGIAIEAMSNIKAVVMDKTGTITRGNFVLQKAVSARARSEDELLALCAGAEQSSTHPIAASIVAAAREKGLALKAPLSLKEIAGHGIQAQFSQGEVLCGNRKLMEQFGISIEEKYLEDVGYGSEVFVAVNGIFEGYLVISDTIKPDAKAAIRRLKQLRITTAMLTGDAMDSANAVAKETGIDQVHARLLPEDKLSRLTEIRRNHGAVMFVGDGINDAPVLAGADVGAAMGSGADASIEAADVVFMTSAMEAIPQSLSIARITRRIAMENVIFALVIKVAVMALGLFGYASMWVAVFADTGVAMLCILNSIRILYGAYKK